jgi:hypothetical protein
LTPLDAFYDCVLTYLAQACCTLPPDCGICVHRRGRAKFRMPAEPVVTVGVAPAMLDSACLTMADLVDSVAPARAFCAETGATLTEILAGFAPDLCHALDAAANEVAQSGRQPDSGSA